MSNLFKKICCALLIVSYSNSYAQEETVVDMSNPNMDFANIFNLYLYYGKFKVSQTITYQCTVKATPNGGSQIPVAFDFYILRNNYVNILSWNGPRQYISINRAPITAQFTVQAQILKATDGNEIAESPVFLAASDASPTPYDVSFNGNIHCQLDGF